MSDPSDASPIDNGSVIHRREERASTNWIALVRLADGTEVPCTVKDVSPSGARLGIPAAQTLPETFLLKVVGRDFICQVRLAWRRGNYVGVLIERIGKLPKKDAPAEYTRETQAQNYKALGPRKSRISAF